MARKKKSKISPVIFKLIGVGILSAVVGVFLCNLLYTFVINSKYFTVKKIVVEKTLRFIEDGDFSDIEGKNIFKVDLQKFQKKLRYTYPQISDLKLTRHFPNQINVVAKRRDPVAQMKVDEKILTLDENGIVLSIIEESEEKLPFLKGVDIKYKNVSLGLPLKPKVVRAGLDIIKAFNKNNALLSYGIKNLELENTSKINLFLSNDLKVILDKNDPRQKMAVLGIVLKQDTLNFKEIRYIDLRFKEPIIGKK